MNVYPVFAGAPGSWKNVLEFVGIIYPGTGTRVGLYGDSIPHFVPSPAAYPASNRHLINTADKQITNPNPLANSPLSYYNKIVYFWRNKEWNENNEHTISSD